MTKQPDVYTTLGQQCGCCGHRHRTVRQAGRCLEDYRRRGLSDRIVVAVAADAAWPPTEGRYLNDTELEALYSDAGNRKGSSWPMKTDHVGRTGCFGRLEKTLVTTAGPTVGPAGDARVGRAEDRDGERGSHPAGSQHAAP